MRKLIDFAIGEGWHVRCDRLGRRIFFKAGMPAIAACPVKTKPILAYQMTWVKNHCHAQ
jgi:hypothetical protein